jgi:hypothetical protein
MYLPKRSAVWSLARKAPTIAMPLIQIAEDSGATPKQHYYIHRDKTCSC